MTTNKIHTSNPTLTDKQIVREMFRVLRKSDKLDFARIDITHYRDKVQQKIAEAGMEGKAYVITYGECSKWAYNEHGNLKGELVLDWANRKEEEESGALGEYLTEVAESFGFEVEWGGSWWNGVSIKPRTDVEWNTKTKQWEVK